jgi:hypothetical protein
MASGMALYSTIDAEASQKKVLVDTLGMTLPHRDATKHVFLASVPIRHKTEVLPNNDALTFSEGTVILI